MGNVHCWAGELNENPHKTIYFVEAAVPRQIFIIWVEFLRENHPTMEQFGVAREQLQRKVEADPTDPFLVTPLAYADLALGRKEDSIQEGKRAMEMRPISEDAVDGPDRATNSLSSPGPSRLTTEHTLLRALACQPGLKPAES